MLQLPPNIQLVKAQVLLLRLTIPVDIYSSAIVVEVNGVEGHVRVLSDIDIRAEKGKPSPGYQSKRGMAAQKSSRPSWADSEGGADQVLPSATDLAQSFLQTEPPEERAELEAAIMSQSEVALSDDGDDESIVGTGTALALPAFMANFLKGIVDRLQIRVHGITLNFDVDMPNESLARSGDVVATDSVTLQIKVEDVDIEGVTFGGKTDDSEAKGDSKSTVLPLKDGKRLISFRNLRGLLISDAGLFASLARSSAMSSPSATHSDLRSLKSQSHSKRSFTAQSRQSSMNSVSPSVKDSFSASKTSSPPVSPGGLSASRRSLASSGRFDDAPEDDGIPDFEDEVPAAMMSGSILDDSAFLDQVADSHFLDGQSDDSDSNFPFEISKKKNVPSGRSPQSTPRASMYLSSERKPGRFTNPASLAGSLKLEASGSPLTVSRLGTSESPDIYSGPASPILAASSEIFPVEDKARFDPPQNVARESSAPPSDVGSSVSGDGSLMESRLFTHEDAESMYMSAMSHGSESRKMPGGWNRSESDETEQMISSNSSKTEPKSRPDSSDNLEHAQRSIHADDTTGSPPILESANPDKVMLVSTNECSIHSSQVPLGASIPSLPKTRSNLSETSSSPEQDNKLAKQLFSLDHIGIYLPPTADGCLDLNRDAEAAVQTSRHNTQVSMAQSVAPALPGAFSTPSLNAQARIRSSRSDASRSSEYAPPPKETNNSAAIDIVMGHLSVHFDVSVARLLFKLFQAISGLFEGTKPAAASTTEETTPAPLSVNFHADRFSLKFLERLLGTRMSKGAFGDDEWVKPPSTDVLLRTTLKGLDVRYNVLQGSTTAAITLQKFVFGYAKENILSFDADLRMRESVRDLAATAGVDISIHMVKTPQTSRFKISTLPIHVSVNLQKLDETFSWFGGLSSVLNMTSSMGSNSTMTTPSPSKAKSRGVRFDTPIKPADDSMLSQNKVDARIGGFVLDLIGKDCSVGLDTTAVKIVSREEGIGLGIDQIKVSGPHLGCTNDEPAIQAQIIGTRVEFLGTPKNADLDRLLALITPSKAKYDRDDDILLDTLLRQRRQGAVLRVTMDQFKSQISQLERLKYLPGLGEEIAKLSTVAKYLPEDDRPGLLSLVLVRDFDLNVHVKSSIGSFRARAVDIEAAQITLPALVALSVSTLTVHRNGTEELLGPATNAELRQPKDRSPAIMARMIGDEMEPIVKVKLWNLKAEYRVPTLMTLLGLGETATTEDMATSLAASVATLTDRKQISLAIHSGQAKEKEPKSQDSKALTVDLGIRDCILGLNPLGLPSKVLIVMTEAHVSAILPKDNNTSATGEMGKGSLLVVDNITNITTGTQTKSRRHSFDGGSTQVADLCSQGFVSLGYVASAKAIIRASTGENPDVKHIDIELRDDLFVLESCADSTQTLIAALGALAPPSPPSKEVKYRTKVMPMQDLLASFTGDAFESPDKEFDFDEEFGSHVETGLENESSNLDFDSEYYAQEHFAGSLAHSAGESSRHGSVLFDQDHGKDTDDGVLLQSFSSKQHVHIHEELDFKEDHFGTGSVVEGTAHRWNSAKNAYDKSDASKVRESPLKVCVRDVHIIWNLFDGYDWQATKDAITKAVQEVESKAIDRRARHDRRSTAMEIDFDEEETVIGDFLFNSIYIGVPGNKDPRELAMAINQELHDNATETESVAATSISASPSRQASSSTIKGKRLRLNRSKHHKITFELKGVNVDIVAFPPNSGETQSSIDIRVHDFDIYDHVPTSTWKKFATYMHDAGEREAGASQIHIELLNVRPVAELTASEFVLRANILPLRLHVDQDALDFITRFFEFKDDAAPPTSAASEPPFIQRAEVNDVRVRLDFKPKRVDYAGIRSGHTTEFMNFIVLDEANMVLKHTILYGVSGFDRLGKMLNDVWMPEIKQNQLPGILAGLAPVRSLANFGGGVRDLVEIPIREYRKDGRLVRALSKGAVAFARTSGTELIKLGAKLAIGTQTVLEGAEGMLGGAPAAHRLGGEWEHDGDSDSDEPREISLYADQPVGVVQGLRGAYKSLERDLVMARDAIIAVPGEVMESGSAVGAVKAVGRRAPTVILRPLVGGTKAVGKTLLGVGNWADPGNLRRVEDVSNPCYSCFAG